MSVVPPALRECGPQEPSVPDRVQAPGAGPTARRSVFGRVGGSSLVESSVGLPLRMGEDAVRDPGQCVDFLAGEGVGEQPADVFDVHGRGLLDHLDGRPGPLTFVHTEVPPEHGGSGAGSALARTAEYQDLLCQSRSGVSG